MGGKSIGEYLGSDGRSLLLGSVVSVAIEFLLFGGYAILYAVCIHILVRQNKKHAGRKINILLMTTLFIIATVVTFLLVAETVTHLNSHIDCGKIRNELARINGSYSAHEGESWDRRMSRDGPESKSLRIRSALDNFKRVKNDTLPINLSQSFNTSNSRCKDSTEHDIDDPTTAGLKTANKVFFVLANMLGDGILIYRVYHIWNRSARVTYAPIVASVINNVIALVSVGVDPPENSMGGAVKESLYSLYLILNIVLNVFLTGLIAGRVWYIRQQAQYILKDALKERYSTTIVICIESGVLYPLFLAIFIGLQLGISSLDFFPILVQAVGIAPTLITFRSSLGVSMDSVDKVVQSRQSNFLHDTSIRRGFGSARSATIWKGGYNQDFFPKETGVEPETTSVQSGERNSVQK